jgi:protein gp37
MSDKTGIEWTDATWNPVTGCTKVSEGCDHCYAETIAHRFAGTKAYPDGFAVTPRPERLEQPLRWKRPRRIFVNSMSDLFHKEVADEYIARAFAVMFLAPQHTFQVLTKRSGRMRALLSSHEFVLLVDRALYEEFGQSKPQEALRYWPLPNVWLGVSVESQKWADVRIPILLDPKLPAAVRFLSCEPLLGPVDLGIWFRRAPDPEGINWVIVGGESGPGARPMHPDWARSLRDECQQAQVPYLFKQWGEHAPLGPCSVDEFFALGESRRRERLTWMEPDGAESHGWEWDPTPGASLMERVGKKAAGRALDGRTWDEYPAVSA